MGSASSPIDAARGARLGLAGGARAGRSRERARLAGLFAASAKIGLIGFGGGNALVPVIERELVRGRGLVTPEEFDKEVVVANITPGALPIEVASGVGRAVAGPAGMVAGAVGMGLPGALLTLALLALFAVASGPVVQQVRYASVGVAVLIVYVLATYAAGSVRAKAAGRDRRLALALLAGVFLLTCGKRLQTLCGFAPLPITVSTLDVLAVVFFFVFATGGSLRARGRASGRAVAAVAIAAAYVTGVAGVGPFAAEAPLSVLRTVMAVLGAAGLVRSFAATPAKPGRFPWARLAQEAVVWVAFIAACVLPAVAVCPEAAAFAGNAVASVLMSFGGGDAYLAFGHGVFVDTGLVSSADYYEQIVTVSNAMPGSIIAKVLTGTGFVIGSTYGAGAALLVALAGFGIGVGASGLTFLVVYYVYDRFEGLAVFGAIKRCIRPVIGGLLLTIVLQMLSLNVGVATSYDLSVPAVMAASAALLVLLVWMGHVRELPIGAIIAVAMGWGLASCAAIVAL